MLDKPVIIIGGGLWGSLLALRLKRELPQVRFELHEPNDQLGDGLSVSFHQSDLSQESFKWLRPFITTQWKKFQVDFPSFQKIIEDSFCWIQSRDIDQNLRELIPGERLFFRSEITLEEALRRGSYVIDTRSNGYFKAQGYQKSLGLLVRTRCLHGLKYPITVDATVEQKSGFRYLQYLPVDENTLFVKDSRYSNSPTLYDEYFETDILEDLALRNWEAEEVLFREGDFRKIPREEFVPETRGRIIRLEGFYHDTTGEILPDAVRLIERMVNTSFRYGELKEVLKNYQLERASKKKILKGMNRILYQRATPCHSRYQYMQLLYQLPSSIREKFYAGDLEMRDVGSAMLRTPLRSFQGLFHYLWVKNEGRTSPAFPSRN